MPSPLDLTNRTDAQQTSAAVPSFLPLLPGLTKLSSPPGFASAAANCLQAVTGTLAKPASRDSERAAVRCAPRRVASIVERTQGRHESCRPASSPARRREAVRLGP